jgi:molybdopterin-guanine dinucleotide biosynthesis protein A
MPTSSPHRRPDSEARFATVSGAVLTGGASTRMGRDKARLELGGVPCATRVARVLEPLCAELLLVGGDPPESAPGRRVPDPAGPVCALRGLCGALEASGAGRVLVVATDLPLVTPDLLLALMAWPEADAVVPRSAEGPHPLCALYRREAALPAVRGLLAQGRLKLQGVLDALDTAWLEPADVARVDPDGLALSNLNTPRDLARAEAALRGGPA